MLFPRCPQLVECISQWWCWVPHKCSEPNTHLSLLTRSLSKLSKHCPSGGQPDPVIGMSSSAFKAGHSLLMWSPPFSFLSTSQIWTCSESYTWGWKREPDWRGEPVQSSGSLSQTYSTSKPEPGFHLQFCSFITKLSAPCGAPLPSLPGPVHSLS